MQLKDVDTGAVRNVTVEVCKYNPTEIRVTFGNSFAIQLSWHDASKLGLALEQHAEEAIGQDPDFTVFTSKPSR